MRSDTTVPANTRGSHRGDVPGWIVRHWRGLSFALLALGGLLSAAAVAIVGWIGAERVIHPQRQVEDHDLGEYDFAPATETVRFQSLDGTPLAAWFVAAEKTPAPAVILLHGWGRSKAEQLPKADFLRRAGYTVLLLDFRNRGESGGDAVTMGAHEPLDVRAAVDYVSTRPEVDPNRIVAAGVSLGSSAGILAMQDDPRIKAIISESSFADLMGVVRTGFQHFIHLPEFPFAPVTVWIAERRLHATIRNIRPVNAIAQIGDRPALIIHDLADDAFPPDSGKRLYTAASGPKEFWEIPGAGHAQGYKAQPQEYEPRALAFLARSLGAPQ
jgi:fermentation-respiration switch protein FrsA (DUF1100 family)